jgi:hypothetical protein
MLIYHYTKGTSYEAIKQSGVVLREGEVGASKETYEATRDVFGIPKALWLTREKEMPFTAFPAYVSKGVRIYFADLVKFDSDRYTAWQHMAEGVYRIGFNADEVKAVRYWSSPVRDTLALKGALKGFEAVAKRYGDDVRMWYYTLEPISLTAAITVERWVNGKWVNWPK